MIRSIPRAIPCELFAFVSSAHAHGRLAFDSQWQDADVANTTDFLFSNKAHTSGASQSSASPTDLLSETPFVP